MEKGFKVWEPILPHLLDSRNLPRRICGHVIRLADGSQKMGPGREEPSVTPDERGMWAKEKMLWAWLWIQDRLNQGRLFLLVSSLIMFILVALYGYWSERPGEHVCIFNGRNFICRLLFFCTFVTMITNLTFLCLDPYLPYIKVPKYLHLICLAELATAVIWLFVWALLSMFIMEQWIRSEPSSANVHSTRTIIIIALAGAGCWLAVTSREGLQLQLVTLPQPTPPELRQDASELSGSSREGGMLYAFVCKSASEVLMVVHLTLRLQEFKSSMSYGVSGLYAGQGETLPTKSRSDLRSGDQRPVFQIRRPETGASKSPVVFV